MPPISEFSRQSGSAIHAREKEITTKALKFLDPGSEKQGITGQQSTDR
jgi:hypothetical protein